MRLALLAAEQQDGLARLLSEVVGRSRHDWLVVPDAVAARRSGAAAVLATGTGRDAAGCGLPVVALAGPVPPTRRAVRGPLALLRSQRRARVPHDVVHVLATSPAAVAALTGAELLRPGTEPLPAPLPAAWPRGALLLVAGPLTPASRAEAAVEALRLAVAAGFPGRLVVAGPASPADAGYVDRVRTLARGLDVTVLPDPSTSVLHALLGAASALLAPALEDAGALTREALACGTPVLACADGPDRGTVLHGTTGWLLAPDARAFAHQALMVGVCSAEEMAPMRTASARRGADFTWDAVVRRLDDVLELAAYGLPVTAAAPVAAPAGALRVRAVVRG